MIEKKIEMQIIDILEEENKLQEEENHSINKDNEKDKEDIKERE